MADARQAELKERLKRLREERRQRIGEIAGRVRRQKEDLKKIRDHLAAAGEGATPPRVAGETGMEVSRVMWYLATMKRYGEVREGAKEGGWFRYLLNVSSDTTSGGERQ